MYFLPINMRFSLEKFKKIYINEIFRVHGLPVSIVQIEIVG